MKLITTIDEIQESIPVLFTSSIDRVKPFIGSAERNFLLAVLGRDQYQVLVDAYNEADHNADSIADEEIKEAVKISQRIISNLGYLTGLPVLNVNFSDSGITVTSNAETKQAFKWQVDEVKASIQELGFTAIEELLIYMEEYAPDKFPEYLNSTNYLKHQEYLIRSAAEFSENFNIGGSRYIFKTLSYLMKRVEEQIVKKLYSPAFFESLKSGDLSGKKLELVTDYIAPGIALLTGAKAVVERVITFKNGVAAVNIDGNYDSEKNNMSATREQVTLAVDQLNTDGNAFLQGGLQFILDNVSDFPGFEPIVPRKKRNLPNSSDKGIYAA
ncbi:MAG: hypothetical protein EOO88_47365 [Pedobacter sp.]|nr:MAG: hypothetical protein EOO88_47365 [Pedobacter sp.]